MLRVRLVGEQLDLPSALDGLTATLFQSAHRSAHLVEGDEPLVGGP